MALTDLAIRVDAGTHLGMGHLMRCYSISLLLRESHRVHFYLMETDQPVRTFLEQHGLQYILLPRTEDPMQDAKQFLQHLPAASKVLLDSYSLKTEWQQCIKKAGHRLIVIDDLHAWHHVADHVINHSGGVTTSMYSCEAYTQLHLGYAYRMLRPAFMQGPARRSSPPQFPGQVIISMGASDVPNNTVKLSNACVQCSAEIQVHLLVSRLNPHFEDIQHWVHRHATQARLHLDLSDQQLFDLMAQSDALICPASTIALEGCSVGMIVFAGTTAENQIDNYRGLVESKAVIALGNISELTEEKAQNILASSTNHNTLATGLLAAQKDIFLPSTSLLPKIF